MRVTGIIAEYNPFHNGHAHHIAETRRLSGCDYVIAVMDGHFTQRGDAALIDKWTRARMALLNGADLVIELPALFAVRTADWFARGGVRLLGALGVVDTLSFGCEMADTQALSRAAALMDAETEEFRALLREKLGEGKSHARARGEALSRLLGIDLSGRPNASLAIEYLRANRRLARPMDILAIPRTGAYHDTALHSHASAGAIRAALFRGEEAAARAAMPGRAAALLDGVWPDGAATPGAMDEMLLYALRRMEAEDFAGLPDAGEGLDRLMMKAAREAVSREALIGRMKSRRYTYARLSRLCAHALLGIDSAMLERYHMPPYARVLGFRQGAKPLLRAIDRAAHIPLITDPVRLRGNLCFALETHATDIWGLLTKDPTQRKAGRDYREKMMVID